MIDNTSNEREIRINVRQITQDKNIKYLTWWWSSEYQAHCVEVQDNNDNIVRYISSDRQEWTKVGEQKAEVQND